MAESESNRYKIIIIGESNVGKTSILRRFCRNTFDEAVQPTLGADIYLKEVTINDKMYMIHFWDTAGQEKYRDAIVPQMYHGTAGIIFTFDITKRETFDSLNYWCKILQEKGECDLNSIPSIIVGNKIDDECRRMVTTSSGKEKAEEFSDSYYFEVSAQSGQNIEASLMNLIERVIKSQSPYSNKRNPEQKNGCC